MESRLKVSGHPIQPMLVAFPLGLFVSATIFDIGDAVGGPAFLGAVGYWITVAGLVAAALTGVAGMVDLWDVPPGSTRRTVVRFNLVTAGMSGLFVMVCLIRAGTPDRSASGALIALELLALGVGVVSVRLGARLVHRFDEAAGEATTFDALGPAAEFAHGRASAS